MTNEELAKALGVNVRTVERDRLRGLPMPTTDEPVDQWVARVRKWKTANRRKPGPRGLKTSPSAAGEVAILRWQEARAERVELELKVLKGDLHSQRDCIAAEVRRHADVCRAFAMLGDVLARRLYQAPSPDAIKQIVDEEVRRLTDALRTGAHADDGAAAQ